LPDLNLASRLGVGIDWQDAGVGGTGLPDWEARGYRSSVLKEYAGTILLVEEPHFQNVVGNIWSCISNGPLGSGDLYQTGPYPDAKNFGDNQCGIHSHRFNYLCHDNHVEARKTEQTVVSGTLNTSKGMWTIKAGD
jgi:hypothetical protein